jgi:hypothetical protein
MAASTSSEWIIVESMRPMLEDGSLGNPQWFATHSVQNPGQPIILITTLGPFSSQQDAFNAAMKYAAPLTLQRRHIPVFTRP